MEKHHLLLIISMLYFTEGVITGCVDWSLKGTESCCNACSPGHRLLQNCGPVPATLCTLCEPNTFTTNSLSWYCDRCNKCIAPQIQLKPCNATADTVCGCKPGFRCGDKGCNYCVQECLKGQEPTDELTCRKCPEGTFNNEIHSACKPWRKSCPEGEQMISSGNEFSDIKCIWKPVIVTSAPQAPTVGPTEQITEITTTTTTTNTEKPKRDGDAVIIVIVVFAATAALTIIFIVSMWLVCMKTNDKSKSEDLKPDSQSPELTIMVVEHEEACSFHQPEQEQGSLESINTQDSETKLIV